MEDCINSIIYGFLVKIFGFVFGFFMILLMNFEKISNKLIIFVFDLLFGYLLCICNMMRCL